MNIYEIDQQMLKLLDPETGELLDYEAFAELAMEKDAKIENMALWVKDLAAESKAIAEEIKALQSRKKAADNKAENLKKYLATILDGQKFSTAKCAVSFRTTPSVEVDEDFLTWATTNIELGEPYLRYKEPEVDKVALKDALKQGEVFEYARLVENISTTIK